MYFPDLEESSGKMLNQQFQLNHYMIKQILLGAVLMCIAPFCFSQLIWQNVDSLFQPLPKSVHVFKTESMIDGKANIAYYVEADLNDKNLDFMADTSHNRRLTPTQFFEKNKHPLLVVNTSFFSFATHQNLNIVVNDKRQLSNNIHSIAMKGKDTLKYAHVYGSAIGISKNRKADIAWIYSDSAKRFPYASQTKIKAGIDSINQVSLSGAQKMGTFKKWKMQTAVGGGPVLLQDGAIAISNNEEMRFGGKAIDDKHPRTGMGYTKEGKLIILAVQGRFPFIAEGVSLIQEAQIFKDLGCIEAINLDGGGSSCLLINGKETIKPSDKEGQRPIPAVFIVR